MKAWILAIPLLTLSGCGSICNLATGPQFYGGVQEDVRVTQVTLMGNLRIIGYTDLPFSAVLDTALLPVTGLFELLRALSGWPPRGIP